MATWLLPPGDLTPDQIRAVEMAPDKNRVVFGVAGSGKTQVLIHRADYLARNYNVPRDKYRVFVFTNVIKEYIKSGIQFLGLPDYTVTTFDQWCNLVFKNEISTNYPRNNGSIDFDQIRLSVLNHLKKNPSCQKTLEFALVDEGQDLTPEAFEILKLAARHVTIFADRMQQIFSEGATEEQILEKVGIRNENATLLGAYRNSPYIAQLAAYFIPDGIRQRQYLSQISTRQMTNERPLCFVAENHDDEMDRMAEIIRERQLMNERVGIIVPKVKQVHGFANAMQIRNVHIEKAIPPKYPGNTGNYDFGNLVPKIATYHSAKVLTFDSVILPKLIEKDFDDISKQQSVLRMRLLFVGIARATKWVYLSTIRGRELQEFSIIKGAAKNKHLVIQDGNVAARRTKSRGDDFDDMPF